MVWLIRIKDGLLSKIRKKISKKELESIEKTIQEKRIKKIEITKDENWKINKVKPEFHKEKHKTDELIQETIEKKKTFFGSFKKKEDPFTPCQ